MPPWLIGCTGHSLRTLLVVFAVGICLGEGARAQVAYLDPLPWYVPADSSFNRYLDVSIDRFEDNETRWLGNRVGLTGVMKAGQRGFFYVRAYLLSFHSDDLPVLQRWPDITGEEAGENWPGESRSVGFASPELGLLGPLRLPLLGASWIGLAAGLPIGKNELYPFSSASMPLRVALRKTLPLLRPLRLDLVAGGLLHLDTAKETLNETAFPDGSWLSAAVVWSLAARRWLSLTLRDERRENRRSTHVSLAWWIPLRFGHSFALGLSRQLSGLADRPFQTQFTLIWRLQSPVHGEMEAPAP